MSVPTPSAIAREPRISPRSSASSPRLAVVRDEADGAHGEPEVGQAAEYQHPRPHEDVDAVLVAAHPAREHDLRDVKQGGAGTAHAECRYGVALGALALALAFEDCDGLCGEPLERPPAERVGARGDGGKAFCHGSCPPHCAPPTCSLNPGACGRTGAGGRRSATSAQAQERLSSPFSTCKLAKNSATSAA